MSLVMIVIWQNSTFWKHGKVVSNFSRFTRKILQFLWGRSLDKIYLQCETIGRTQNSWLWVIGMHSTHRFGVTVVEYLKVLWTHDTNAWLSIGLQKICHPFLMSQLKTLQRHLISWKKRFKIFEALISMKFGESLVIPIASMGLVYLPTFTIKKISTCR